LHEFGIYRVWFDLGVFRVVYHGVGVLSLGVLSLGVLSLASSWSGSWEHELHMAWNGFFAL